MYHFGDCILQCSADSVDRLQMIHFQDAEVQKRSFVDLHLPAPVGFAIMRSHEVHGGE